MLLLYNTLYCAMYHTCKYHITFDSEPDLFIDLLILYLFRIFLNEANKCSHASGDMGSTIIKIFCGFCLNARFLRIIAQIFASCTAIPSLSDPGSVCENTFLLLRSCNLKLRIYPNRVIRGQLAEVFFHIFHIF